MVLARSDDPADALLAEAALTRLATDTGANGAEARKIAAAAIRQVPRGNLRPLLIPLLYDPAPEVADEAMVSARQVGSSDFLLVPTLISLLRHRKLKSRAREALVSYGEPVLDVLAHFMSDRDEDVWVRRHLPATIALIPCQRAAGILIDALNEPDGFLRYKAISALEKLHRERPELKIDRAPLEALALKEGARYFRYLSLHYNLFIREGLPADSLLALALAEKMARTVDRIYRLLALIYPWKDVAAARWTLERGESRARASAVEYLDNIFAGSLRKRLLPILEDLPLEEKVRRGNVLLKTRPRDAEDSLLYLINDEDAVVSAAAIDLVHERRLWNLAGDLEHVLAHRDPRDWYVFEAASWALAAHRLTDERRRSLWLEPLPAVEVAARLRKMPLFGSVIVDELFRLAGAGRQIRYEDGRLLIQEGAVPQDLLLLLDGAASGIDRADSASRVLPPAAIAFEELLEGAPARQTIRTAGPSVCLTVSGDDCRTLLADNAGLVEGLFRMVAEGAPAAAERMVLRGDGGALDAAARATAGDLTPIDKVLALKRVPVFAQLSADPMLHLADIAREVRFAAGTVWFAEAHPPALYVVLEGEALIERDDEAPVTATIGDVVGMHQTLAGIPSSCRARALSDSRALRIDREDLFDLLGHRPLLLQQLFGALFRTRDSVLAPVA